MENIKKIVKSRWVLYTLLAIFCVFLASTSADYDYDLYARLIVGENFIEQGVFNYKDFWSYTPSHLWYDHEWGASIIFYAFFKVFGNFGFVLVQVLTMFVTAFFIIKTQKLQKHAYPVSLAFIALFLAAFMHQNPSLVRCHLFSFMFFSMFLYFLEKTRISNSNAVWWIPFVTLLWNNIHGGVVSGLGILFIYLVSQIVLKKPYKKFLYVLLVSTGILIINPYGFDYVKFLIMANTMTRKYITEWWNVFAPRHIMYYYPLFCIGVFTILYGIFNFKKLKREDLTKVILLLVTAFLGAKHVKLLSLPLITVSALFYNEICGFINSKKLRMAENLAIICIIVCIFFIPSKKPFEAKTNIVKYPVKEVEFLKINNIKGNVLSEFGLSSYIAYKLYPDNLIYLDGRYEEVYNDTEFNKLMHYELVDENWQDILKDYPTEILMPEKIIPVYSVLEKNKDWVKIYEGNVCGIFVKKEKVRKNYIMPDDDIEYYRKNEFVNLGYFGREKNKYDRKS